MQSCILSFHGQKSSAAFDGCKNVTDSSKSLLVSPRETSGSLISKSAKKSSIFFTSASTFLIHSLSLVLFLSRFYSPPLVSDSPFFPASCLRQHIGDFIDDGEDARGSDLKSMEDSNRDSSLTRKRVLGEQAQVC